MAFEPQVERSLKKYRRRARGRVYLVLMPVLVILIAMFLLISYMTLVGTGLHTSRGFSRSLTSLEPLLMLMIFAVVFPAIYYFGVLKPIVEQYRSLTRPFSEYDHRRLHLFQEAAEGAAIAAGVAAPRVVPVGMPTANALTFEVGGRPAIGVTPEMLDARLSGPEVEAVMAHQVAHAVARTGLKAPVALKLNAMIAIALVAVLCPLVLAFALGNLAVSFLPMFVLPVAPLYMSVIVRPYMPYRQLAFTQAAMSFTGSGVSIWTGRPTGNVPASVPATVHGPGHDEDLFADSLASKMISNPRALESALKKLAALMSVAAVMPTQTITFPHLFVPPMKPWPIPPGFEMTISSQSAGGSGGTSISLGNLFSARRDSAITPMMLKKEMDIFIQVSRNLLTERIENLNLIESAVWTGSEEVVDGAVRSRPDAWE